jgi:hypothetical protein
MLGKALAGVAALGAGSAIQARPARADHRLAPGAQRLEEATEALLTELTRPARRNDRNESGDEVLGVMAAGGLHGQARALRELIENENSDLHLRVAMRELRRQVDLSERRVLHSRVTRRARQRFQDVQEALDELGRGRGSRGRYTEPDDESDRSRDDRARDDRYREDEGDEGDEQDDERRERYEEPDEREERD